MKFFNLSTLWAALLILSSLSLTAQNGTSKYNDVTFGPDMTELLTNQNYNSQDVRVIFTFSDAGLASTARPILQQMGGEFVGPKFDLIPIQGVNATMEEVLKMTKIPGIIGVWKDKKMNTELHQAVIASSVSDVWADSEFMNLNDGIAVEGNGVGVLINDSGFDGMDSDIQATNEGSTPGRLVQNVKGTGADEWIEDSGDDNDQGGGHGSHCMGIVGGDGRHSDGKFTGVAPKAHLLGYGSGAGLFILDTGGGFEYVAQHRKDYNIRVMSNSFGTTSDTMFLSFDAAAPLNVATKALTDSGVIVVFSAGNSGPTDGKITGNYKTAPWVITVGNGEKSGTLASSSSPGRPDPAGMHPSLREEITVGGTPYLWENRPTITAPGTDIVSVRSTAGALGPLSALDDVNLEPDEIPFYTTLTGTSMACPHVAGIVALLVEANPQMDWRAAKAILQRTAIPMTEQIYRRGMGYVNAHAAVAAAFNGLCAVSEGASHEEKYGLRADGGFGFDDDVWKTCPLNQEVIDRLKATIPEVDGVEPVCAVEAPPLTDPSADGPLHADIEEVIFHDETSTDFKITLKVGDLLSSPPGTPTSQHPYDVHFTLTKPTEAGESGTPDVTYIVQAVDVLANKEFKLTVKTADGTTRPNTAMIEPLEGVWDTGASTITWTVPKAKLNVSMTPAAGADPVIRTSREARAGDKLQRWASYTYERPGAVTPDGPGVYNDSALGVCFKNLVIK